MPIPNRMHVQITQLDICRIRRCSRKTYSLIFSFSFFDVSYGPPLPPPSQGYPPYGAASPYPDPGYAAPDRTRSAGFNPLLQAAGPVTTTQVTIPTDMAGKSTIFVFV